MKSRAILLAPVLLFTFGFRAPLHAQPPGPVHNLRAFAKLYGYVRWFHPSDEAAELDWEAFAAHGATRVKDAASSEQLGRTLQDLFSPFAPTVQVYAEGEEPPVPAELSPPDAADLDLVAWQHLGVGFGASNSIYRSARLNRETTLSSSQLNAVLTQRVDPTPLLGKEVRLRAMGKVLDPGARLQLWMRVDLPDREQGFFDNMADRPVTSTDWEFLEIEGTVADNAVAVVLGAIILGGGTALDDLRLEVREGEEWVPADAIQNGDFEEGETGDLTGWHSSVTGWEFALTEGDAPHGDRHLRIVPETDTVSGGLFPYAPAPGEVVEKPLGLGLMARVPLALQSRNGHTLGATSSAGLGALSQALENLGLQAMTGEDEALRLADVIIAWNIFQHFYPYFDVVDTDWDQVLTIALDRVLADASDEDFLATLRWMVSELRDGHGYVAGPVQPPAGISWQVDWIEEQVVVVAVGEGSPLQVGDVVVSLDGVPATELLEESSAVFSGSPQWRRWRALAQFGAGTPGTEASLLVRRASGELPLAVPRQAQPEQVNERRPENIEELEPGIFYVNLDLAEITAIRERAVELAAARGVVFDLRGYPNGNHEALTYLSDSNLNSAFWRVPQIIYPDHDGEAHFTESRWNLPPSEPRFQGKIVFLTNGRAISYAESVMGIVEHYRLGEIVGGTTAGANGNVNPFTLPGGYRFSWTGMQVIKHDGTQHHLVGIHPTIPMTRTVQGVRERRDELLEKALEVIRGG